MAGWYFQVAGRQVGPISDKELVEQASNGTLSAEDMIWQPGMSDWVPVSEVLAFDGDEPAAGAVPTVPTKDTGPPPPPTPGEAWHYLIDGEQQDAVRIDELGALYKQRTLVGDDLVWNQALDGWQPINTIEALRPFKPVGLAMPPNRPAPPASKSKRKKKKKVAKKKTKAVVPTKKKTVVVKGAKAKDEQRARIPGGIVAADDPFEDEYAGSGIGKIILLVVIALVVLAVLGFLALRFLR